MNDTDSVTPAPVTAGCETCDGLCCRHIATSIDKPTKQWEYDQVRWFLMHDKVTVGVDQENDWLLEVATKCRNLGPDNRCLIYATRPKLCRDYPGKEELCEHADTDHAAYKLCFTSVEQFDDYLRSKGKL